MEKYKCAYKYTVQEAEELLQCCLDDKEIELINHGYFYYAESDTNCLDGSEVDERMAQILHVEECEHYAIRELISGREVETMIVLIR